LADLVCSAVDPSRAPPPSLARQPSSPAAFAAEATDARPGATIDGTGARIGASSADPA
jgi:hypothetical protein